jgi:5-methylcytosine-specific restriction endonuclease McrBC GTP-binding regulatory subunit McrB
MTKHPLNCILYGPPGTGKTHYTVLKAAEIIENRTIDSYDEALKIFKANLHNQIEFITFHQNYSYEDFIQGLRPDTDNNASLVFDKKDGVFLKIATDALFEYYKGIKSNQENSGEQDIDLNEAYLDFIEHLKNIENKYFETSTGSVIHISGFTKNDNIEFKHGDSSRNYLVSANRLLKLYHIFSDIKHIKNVHNDIRDAIGGCNTTVYWVALKEFISFINNVNKKINIEETNIEKYDEIGYESKKKLLSTVELDTLRQVPSSAVKNYVIIIDEINRANISRVFGELITLIESYKRSHGTIPLEAKLPSGDTFVVPSNLYIIGTMNTADKSIALLDIALRRRFEFEAMYPKYKIDNQEIYDVQILEKINARIKKSKGHDFQIGHAYFMGENNDLVKRMNNKVIPLLLEYYMNDENEVKDMLQSAGLVIEENSWPLRIKGKND